MYLACKGLVFFLIKNAFKTERRQIAQMGQRVWKEISPERKHKEGINIKETSLREQSGKCRLRPQWDTTSHSTDLWDYRKLKT